jgi:secondary thiamine-phosphate synthase enzyme
MRQAQHILTVETRGAGLVEITADVRKWVSAQGMTSGLLTLFCRHTSASLVIQENADPDVRTDLENYFADLAPEAGDYIHTTEGPDDMPAHIRTALTGVQLSVPLAGGKLLLGTWQGIFLFEHRRADEPGGRVSGAAGKESRARKREVVAHLVGE